MQTVITQNMQISRPMIWLLVGLSSILALVWATPPAILHEKGIMALWVHTMAESFSIIVDMMIFGVAWHAYNQERPGNILIIACGLLAVGLLDMGHVLSYKGMPDFITPSNPEKGINFWLAARFTSALTLLAISVRPWAPFTNPRTRFRLLISSLSFTAFIYWLCLLHQDLWPHTFIEGQGLTQFKSLAEIALCLILLIASIQFYRRIKQTRDHGTVYLWIGTMITILSESCFIGYADVTDLFNLVGHAYKIIAYTFIYQAIFVVSIREPYLQLRQTREALSFQKNLLNAQGEATDDGVLTVSADRKILWHNQKLLEIWQLPESLIMAGDARAILADNASKVLDQDTFLGKVQYLYQHPDTVSTDEFKLLDGRTIERYSAPVRDGGGRYLARVWRFRDVTTSRTDQAELAKHRDHLEELVLQRTKEAIAARQEAERANDAKSLFLANMSHELRTPMHAILSFSQLGLERAHQDRITKNKLQEYFTFINQSGTRLLNLLNDLLDLAKLEAGKMQFHPSEVDLRQLIDNVVQETTILASPQDIRFRTENIPKNLLIECDGHRITQVLHNLLSNAIKFSPQAGLINISASLVDLETQGTCNGKASVRVQVRDEGMGIPEEDLESIFDKFIQSSRTHSKSGGTGLGLSICREIIEGHGGTIHARNNPDRGASFIFTLPLKQLEEQVAEKTAL
jgi:signal transduction histidine kinase